jgi:HEAT repeat protein
MISAEALKPFLKHPDRFVRVAVAEYFRDGRSRDPEILPLVLEACEGMATRVVRQLLEAARSLVVTEPALDRLLQRLDDAEDESVRQLLAERIVEAPPALLKARETEILEHPQFPIELEPRVHRRLMLAGWDDDRLWTELEEIAQEADEDTSNDPDLDREEDVIELLGERSTPDEAALLARLDDPKVEGSWLEVHLVDVIGRRGLRSAVPALISRLILDDDFMPQAAVEALVRIGDPEALLRFRDIYRERLANPNEDASLRFSSIDLLGHFKHPSAEQVILELLEIETDVTLRTFLCVALCEQFSERGVEVVLREIEAGYDTTLTSLESELLPVIDVLGIDVPEANAWRGQREEDDEHYARIVDSWDAMEAEDDFDENEFDEDDFDEDEFDEDEFDEDEFDERPPAVTLPIRNVEPRVGRNDPCPCGSGKKFKKCCGRHD